MQNIAIKIALFAAELATVQACKTYEQLGAFMAAVEALPKHNNWQLNLPAAISEHFGTFTLPRLVNCAKYLFNNEQIAAIYNCSEFYSQMPKEVGSTGFTLYELLTIEWLLFTACEGSCEGKPLSPLSVGYFMASHWRELLSYSELQLLQGIANEQASY